MAFTLTPQQKQIFEHMRSYQEAVSYKKVAEDMGLSSKDGVLSQLGKLKKNGLVDEPEDKMFIIAEKAQEKLDEAGEDTVVSLADVNLTPQQHFTKIGRTFGINPERLVVIVNTIWTSGDPEDLDHVWKKLGRMMVSSDVKRQWIEAWQSYLGQEKPEKLNWQPPSLTDEKVAAEVDKAEVKRRVEAVVDDGPKEYVIDVKKNEPIKVGESVGLYSLKEAKELVGMRLWSQQISSMSGTQEAKKSETISDILTALAPYLKESKDSSEVMALLRELFDQKLNMAINELAARFPQDGGDKKQWYEILPQIMSTIKELGPIFGPILRESLGLPPPGAVVASTGGNNNSSGQTPIQILDQNGNPLTMNLGDLLQLRRFDAEQKREDDKHKASMDMMTGLRDFMGKIGTAANRLAGERK